ncbi:MAG: L,D-transpeptidase family protein [Chthoniobacterales bacterium]
MKKSARPSIHISVARQRLTLRRGGTVQRTFPISTSRFGLGNEEGSLKTPTGRFRVAAKIGDGQPIEIAYKARMPIRATRKALQSDDLVMSRILWLDGLDARNANTYERYIYIHGTNHEDKIGEPASHGCIRMRNADVAELFDLVTIDTPVLIVSPKRRRASGKKPRKALRRGTDLPK